ncbi:MAG TPA: hypothetical protein VFB20_02440 [Burkholderiales bacterium]|nr:hypothetical protein [Burkholderiales bacterium]
MNERLHIAVRDLVWRIISAVALSAASCAALAAGAIGFQAGTTDGGITLGAGRAVDQNYTVIGGRLGYFVADGFELAMSAQAWRGADPVIYKFIPEVRYIWYQSEPVQPYVAGFYSFNIYQGLPDKNSYGAKGGIYFPVGPNASLSLGLVYEAIESCNSAVYRECSDWYPEIGFLVTFR